MPSTATITSFYTFASNTKARASQVNNNFDVFRGHILPIDPNTQTAINNTYALGSTEYRWNNLYSTEINLTGATTTGNIIVVRDTATTTTEALLKFGTTEISRFNQYGIKKHTLNATTSATYYGLAASPHISQGYATTGATSFPNSTITISTLGNPLEFFFIPSTATTSHIAANGATETNSFISILQNGTTIATSQLYSSALDILYPAGSFRFVIPLAAGTYNFHLTGRNVSAGGNIALVSVRFACREI
jgi:hypothetical protein